MSDARNPASAVYEIQIQGELDQGWETFFGNLSITVNHPGSQAPATTLIGVMEDQAALRGTLCRLWDLNLTIVSVRRTEREEKDG